MTTIFESIDRAGRFGEWMTSAMMLMIALTMMLPGDTMRYSDWGALRSLGVREEVVVGVLMPIAIFRFSALITNGWWHRTPLLRGIGSIAGMAIWGCMTVLAAWPWAMGEVSAPHTVVGFYLILGLSDMRGVSRAGADYGHADAYHSV